MAERKILLDAPSTGPDLGFGFEDTARVLAQVITESKPRFAVGIFGGWGSGKTTLMEAIQRQLKLSPSVVCAEFNAWRFEREPQLLIPLLDMIRAALVQWADHHPSPPEDIGEEKSIRSIAARVGRVVRALATGLSVNAGLPGAVAVQYDFGTASDALTALSSPPPAEPQLSPQSLYVAAFAELKGAFEDLSDAGVSRVVVFVDDLDRCLPSRALEVLDSLKLFFDLEGFIFVVGLDENAVQRAVRSRFSEFGIVASTSVDGNEGVADTSGQEIEQRYIDKIFQVPYRLLPALAGQLDELLKSMCSGEDLPKEQWDDFKDTVAGYLKYIAIKGRVNPREVKRFLNAYTLQRLIRVDLESDIILALQVLAFRYDWRSLYDAILANSESFLHALNRYRPPQKDDAAFEDISPGLNVSSTDLGDYLRSALVAPLAAASSLDSYLSLLRVAGAVDRPIDDAYRANYTANVMAILRKALPQDWYLIREPQTSDYRFDAMIVGPNDKQIVTEAFFNPNFFGGQFSRAIRNARESQQLRIDAVLVVAASRNAPGFRRLKEDFSTLALPNQVVEWDPGKPDMTLIGAMNELIGELSA
jgi:KAP family P-loop domain